jgi:hypothetical protein
MKILLHILVIIILSVAVFYRINMSHLYVLGLHTESQTVDPNEIINAYRSVGSYIIAALFIEVLLLMLEISPIVLRLWRRPVDR